MHVMVLAGGLSYERDVSLRSGRRVSDALRRVGVETTTVDADADLLSTLHTSQPDAVFIALHGAPGEDGALRGVLDAADVPYVGRRRRRVTARLGQAGRQDAPQTGWHRYS
ncbi:D-alanine--D-alanine ligase family protein [Fodinicola feengrottensis]|uniref:hypothetical protein n=1 Tax=Fodinicola feengrottensis TaxID=435914 RepID=UPI002442F298|nr:hypothetical protein [Fodinicola feengrottensis]